MESHMFSIGILYFASNTIFSVRQGSYVDLGSFNSYTSKGGFSIPKSHPVDAVASKNGQKFFENLIQSEIPYPSELDFGSLTVLGFKSTAKIKNFKWSGLQTAKLEDLNIRKISDDDFRTDFIVSSPSVEIEGDVEINIPLLGKKNGKIWILLTAPKVDVGFQMVSKNTNFYQIKAAEGRIIVNNLKIRWSMTDDKDYIKTIADSFKDLVIELLGDFLFKEGNKQLRKISKKEIVNILTTGERNLYFI